MENRPVGVLLREWRERRRLSQLELSIQADISTRHLSFVETGRSRPTSAMILRLTEQLDVPLRERNALLLAGGYAPAYPEGRLDGPQLKEVRASLRQVLAGHEPYPAVVVDRRWDMLDANAPIARLIEGVAAHLLEPPVNVLRLSLHPDGLAPRIVNLAEWRAHLLSRLERQVAATGAADLRELLEELRGYPGGGEAPPKRAQDVVVPFRIRVGNAELRFFSITAVFGSPLDVTVSELAIESFFPADEATSAALRRL
ncbi:transcriptional regulator [Dactylosporangium sucinum]|uniref:Transcriptional regulator n=2 Tax=Dactylosporangium sucinum TaxID=1424081 RepID=A0A917UFM8_9ACTN|nr:transcriptional regulator [Dactylosporangium sucinum]